MKFRRSIKSDKHDSASAKTVGSVSIPQKDAIAIEPPKKVIKAIYDYNAPPDTHMYMSFSAGDFLHVVSRENDPDWYEACNPLRNERGLVPVKYFEQVGKTVRDSGDSSQSVTSTTHDSGYAEGSTTPSITSAPRMPVNMNGAAGPMAGLPEHRPSKSFGKSPAGIYGIVSYDFHAERPDELDAKEGEAIIVIAQSNPEWFVAKPITRLGGPGLIPVSFIEIRDMVTGRAAEDPLAAVQAAGIPRVEEWKKMAAEYKNTSIPLGTVSTAGVGSMEQAMGRMSLQQPGAQTANGSMHSRQASFSTQQQQNMFAPLRASVPRYTYNDDKFHFVVECMLSNNTHWDLSRIYEDFYELQINMINAFPDEAGQTPGKQRILPYMPGPVKYVTDNITEGRRANLDEYLRDLLRLPQHIIHSSLVRGFFAPKEGDYEVDPGAVDLNEHARPSDGTQRHSQASQGSGQSGLQQQYQSQAGQARAHQYTPSQASTLNGGTHRPQPSQASASFSSQSPGPGGALAPPPVSRQHTNVSHTTINSTASSTGPVKVKAWFDRDTCVVIRMPARGNFGFEDLRKKIVERRKLEFANAAADQELDADDLEIEYRDEKDGEYYRLEGDEDLDIAVERNEKLTLAVRAPDGSGQG
ncbi:Putative PB1 domain, SH3 domain, SH3-like domain superfamily, PX domain superfamily protein [Septoria linicola]|uniref:PB1 domain, SH3 domain, SH3-like domain superfamily, PX domain superfamily protein n=1 Tax=Septoria linicola TaxID=215465 RepID=A0A9Q9ELM9_9PEZI|nr:putative PB1 domain, SH3 domain, SH3-like domain superfamily, PX domain superfamily protein [Septoria linicola]USW54524.1 Putative PB1 domain, SH3 domain, SH3-like domain superfamily, PX domain superfamily protein [Septoria linicola]